MNARHARPRNLPGPGRVPATWGVLRLDANRTALDLEARARAGGVDANGHTIAVTLHPLDALTAGAELTTAGLRAAAHHPTIDTRDAFDITEADRDVS